MFGQKETSLLTGEFKNDHSIWHVFPAIYLMHENKYVLGHGTALLHYQLRGVDLESLPTGKQTQPHGVTLCADSASTTCNIPHSPFLVIHGLLSVGLKLTTNIACDHGRKY
jgi:hypothetical protein